nr:double-stranded RNA-binding protein Staufen homolog [Onthophagus taurus]
MILTNAYNLFVMSLYVLLFCLIKVASSISTYDLFAKFDKQGCVEGTILEIGRGGGQIHSELVDDTTDKDSKQMQEEKISTSPLSTVHLLALYNKLTYHYYLENEEGPSHNRIFTITLSLGNEKYTGTGSSIKEAKKAAASLALLETSHPNPPTKTKENVSTPTVELNSLAYKLGLKVTYLSEEQLKESDYSSIQSKSSVPDLKIDQKSSYHTKLNKSIYHPYTKNYDIPNQDSSAKPPFVVAVLVGDQKFIGTGYTKQAARHDAASKALATLSLMTADEKEFCLATGTCNRDAVKSPISTVYEYAQLKQLNLEYEVIREEGPAHEREYVTRCTLGDLTTEGVGGSKKKSKQHASENMVAMLKDIAPSAASSSSNISDGSKKKKKKGKKKNKVIRGFVNKFAQDAKDLFMSTLDYLKPGDNNENKDSLISDRSTKNQEKGDTGESTNFKDMLLEVTQERGIVVHYSDLFKEDSKYFSLVQIGLHPNYVCLGDGQSFEEARAKASMEAMHFFHKIGLDNLNLSKIKQEESIWVKSHEEICAIDDNNNPGHEDKKS